MGLKRRTYGPAIPSEEPQPEKPSLKIQDLQKDQILRWNTQNIFGFTAHEYAIVRGTEGDEVLLAPVNATDYDTKCYDEGGSDPEDKGNVLLRHSSELFEDTHKRSVRGCYAVANNEHPIKRTQKFLDFNHVDDMDGILIDERDSKELDDHL